MKVITILFFFSTIITFQSFCQNTEDEKLPFHFTIGTQIRVTPIYLKRIPDFFIGLPARNVWEQPDMHLSGTFAFVYSIEKEIPNSLSIKFLQSVRYGLLYWTQTLTTPSPSNPFIREEKKSIISDIYFDIFKRYSLRSSVLKFGLGISFNGFGTSYTLTQRFVDNNNQSFYVSSKENFQFPSASFSINWQKGKFNTGLRMAYCWSNPTLFKERFLFPEIGIQYQLFSF